MTALPAGWRRTDLGSLGLYINGRGFKKSEWRDHGRPIIRIQNLTGTSEVFNHFDGDADERYIARPGDLLMSWAATLGAYIWNGPEAVVNQHIFKVDSSIDKKFHKYLLDFKLEELMRETHGSGMVHITRGKFESLPVSVPESLDEQRRIVDILEDHLSRLDAAETLLNQSKRRLATWSRAVVDTAFWDSALIAEPEGDELVESLMRSRKSRWSQSPSGKQSKAPVVADLETFREAQPWPVVSLESATDPNRTIRYGILKPSIGQGGTVRYVEVRDLAGNTLSDKTFRLTSRQLDEQFSASRLAGGDVVIAVRGSYERTAVVPKELNGANLSRDVARIAPLPELLPGLLHYWLQTSSSKAYLNRHARGVAVKGVNISTLRAMPVPLLPLETQRHIVDTLNTQLAAGDRATLEIDRAAKLSETLRRSLLAAAFAGRLTGLASDMEIVEEMAGV